jgi:hypothetical protein
MPDARYYNGAPGEMPYDSGAVRGERPTPEVRVLGHCHDCVEIYGEIVPATRWYYDGLRELPMCAAHWTERDNYEPPYDSGL